MDLAYSSQTLSECHRFVGFLRFGESGLDQRYMAHVSTYQAVHKAARELLKLLLS